MNSSVVFQITCLQLYENQLNCNTYYEKEHMEQLRGYVQKTCGKCVSV